MVIASRLGRARSIPVGLVLIFLAGFSIFIRQTAVAQQTWSLPAPWSAQDIGNPAIAGNASFNQGTFSIHAGGAIGGPSDQFTFIYQQVTGDVDIAARVDSVAAASASSASGLMIRSSLAADAAFGYALVSSSNGVDFQRRSNDGGQTRTRNGPSETATYWVRITRTGTTVTAYSSPDGSSWSTIGSRTVALGTSVYVGIATTSGDPATPTDALVSQVSMAGLSLPFPQEAADIGSPAIQGSTSYSQGIYQIHAGGTDIWGTSDQFHFVYQQLSGDAEVVAHVQSLTNSDPWAKTGVMIRETLAADSRHAFALVTPSNGYGFQRRVDPSGTSTHTAGPAGTAPGWVRLIRTGSRIDAYQSSDGTTWKLIGSDTVAMADPIFVGLATTSHDTSIATDAVVDSFTVTTGSTTNAAPIVAITSPADGTTFTAGNNIVMNAAANDSDGTIDHVDFFAGTTKIGSSTTSPYSVTWSGAAAGTYPLTAVAVDNDGASTTSAPVSIKVDAAAANQPPTVSLTAPTNGATFTAPATVTLSATASDPDGTISKVEFYNGSTLLATDTAGPYTFSWLNLAAGTYTVKAIAYDNSGASTSSATSTITVNGLVSTPPTGVAFTASADHATLVTSYELRIYAPGADPNTATPIAKSNLGKPTPDSTNTITVNQSSFFSALTVGNYLAAVAAIGSGGSSISTGVTFTR